MFYLEGRIRAPQPDLTDQMTQQVNPKYSGQSPVVIIIILMVLVVGLKV
jgi:hypothetical protein